MATLAIVGAGPGLGMGIARLFGKQGLRVALVARRLEALTEYCRQLKELGIEAVGFDADVRQEEQVAEAFSRIRRDLGPVEVLEYSPLDWENFPRLPVDEVTAQIVQTQLEINVLGAVASAQQVLPEMLQRGSGTLFFTAGPSAYSAIPTIAHVGISNTGLRSYALSLNKELAPRGIYAAFVCIRVGIKEGTAGDPDMIAGTYWSMYQKRDLAEGSFPPG